MVALETLVRHASGVIELIDATGLVERTATELVGEAPQPVSRPGPQPLVPDRPVVTVTQAPRRLTTLLKPGRIVLLRNIPAAQQQVAEGGVHSIDLTPPPEADFVVAAEVRVGSRLFNPRSFRRTAGSGVRVPVDLHRAPAGVFGAALSVLAVFDDGAPASWAIVTTRVALADGDPAAEMVFRGQADRRGHARIPLPGLPLPSPAPALTATVTVRAMRAASGTDLADPDTFADATLRGPTSPAFVAAAQFQIEPARPATLGSFDGTAPGDRLVLRQP
jgi:hypothetical protein